MPLSRTKVTYKIERTDLGKGTFIKSIILRELPINFAYLDPLLVASFL